MNLKKNKYWIFKISLLFCPNNYCAVSQQSIVGISLLNMILSVPTDPVIFIFKISVFCTHCPLKQVEFRAVIWNALYTVSLSLLSMGTLGLRCSFQHLTAGDALVVVCWRRMLTMVFGRKPLIQDWCRVSHTFLWRMETGLLGRPGPQPVWLLTEADYKIVNGNRERLFIIHFFACIMNVCMCVCWLCVWMDMQSWRPEVFYCTWCYVAGQQAQQPSSSASHLWVIGRYNYAQLFEN